MESVGLGGVDGDHDLAAQGLVLHAHAVGVDEAEAGELREKAGGWFIANSTYMPRDSYPPTLSEISSPRPILSDKIICAAGSVT